MTNKNISHIGKVIDAHGIRGDLYCLVFSGDTSWISKIKKLELDDQIFEVKKIKAFKKGFIVSLDGVVDRNRAEELKGARVGVESSLFTSEHGESLYLSELSDFVVSDKTLGEIGRITSFSSNGIQDLLVIVKKNKSFEIPFVKDFVVDIDFEKKTIFMDLPSGLLDINEPEQDEKD